MDNPPDVDPAPSVRPGPDIQPVQEDLHQEVLLINLNIDNFSREKYILIFKTNYKNSNKYLLFYISDYL